MDPREQILFDCEIGDISNIFPSMSCFNGICHISLNWVTKLLALLHRKMSKLQKFLFSLCCKLCKPWMDQIKFVGFLSQEQANLAKLIPDHLVSSPVWSNNQNERYFDGVPAVVATSQSLYTV